MNNFLRKAVKQFLEPVAGRIVGRYLAPCSVSVLARGENDDVLVLESEGSYELPGGLIRGGEHPEEAARRETLEETGCEVEIGEMLEMSTEKGTVPGIHFFYEARVVEADLDGSWEGEPVFVRKSELADLDWKPQHAHVPEYVSDG